MPAGKQSDIQVVVSAVDKFSAAMAAFEKSLKGQQQQAEATDKTLAGLHGRMGALGSVMQGVGIGVGMKALDLLAEGAQKLAEVIPDLFNKGLEWARTVHDIGRETGMTAEQASTMAAVMQRTGVPVDNMNRLFALLGKNLSANESYFKNLGIATRASNGEMLDAWTILTNTRRAFAAHGEALTSTAAAQALFSRSGYTMLEFLQLTDAQFRLLADDAAKAGLVIGEDVVGMSHKFDMMVGGLGQQVTGLATQIFAALEPTMEGFVNAFSGFISAHLNEILGFVVTVANFVMGVIGGLLGVDFNAASVAGSVASIGEAAAKASAGSSAMATKGENAVTGAINAQVKAIDAQIAAIDARRAARTATSEEADLEKAVADAQKELADLQASAVNTYGLSEAERVKAEQKRVADIAAASAKVAEAQAKDAEGRLQAAEDAEKKRLEAQKQALSDRAAAASKAAAGGGGGIPGLPDTTATGTGMFDKFKEQAEEARKAGVKFADDVKTKIGELKVWIDTKLGPAIEGIGGFFDTLFNHTDVGLGILEGSLALLALRVAGIVGGVSVQLAGIPAAVALAAIAAGDQIRKWTDGVFHPGRSSGPGFIDQLVSMLTGGNALADHVNSMGTPTVYSGGTDEGRGRGPVVYRPAPSMGPTTFRADIRLNIDGKPLKTFMNVELGKLLAAHPGAR